MNSPEYSPLVQSIYAGGEWIQVVKCNWCGCPVMDKEQHDKWHEILPKFPTSFADIPFPENPRNGQHFTFEGKTYVYYTIMGDLVVNDWLNVIYR